MRLAANLAEQAQPDDTEPTAPVVRKDARVTVDLLLRTHHSNYLFYLADRESIGLSHAVEAIIDDAVKAIVWPPNPAPGKKVRANLSLGASRVLFIDRVAVLWGLNRSQVVMRLIEMAKARDSGVSA